MTTKGKRASDQPTALPSWQASVAWLTRLPRSPRWGAIAKLVRECGCGIAGLHHAAWIHRSVASLHSWRESADAEGLLRGIHTVADKCGWELPNYSGEEVVYYDGLEVLCPNGIDPLREGALLAYGYTAWVECLMGWPRVRRRESSGSDYGCWGPGYCTAGQCIDFGSESAGKTFEESLDFALEQAQLAKYRGQHPVVGWVCMPDGRPLPVGQVLAAFEAAAKIGASVALMGDQAFYAGIDPGERAACRAIEARRMAGRL